MQIVNVLMAPYDAAPLKITLVAVGSKVAATAADKNKICWFQPSAGTTTAFAINQDYTLPTDIVDPGGSVIVAEVAYTYSPLIFSYFIQTAFPLADKFYLKPRVSNFIPYDKTNSGTYVNRDSGTVASPLSCVWP